MSAEVVDSGAEPGAGADESGGRLAAVLRDVRLLLVALWLGGAVFFSAAVAPSAFAVLRARNVPYANEAAGSIVTRTLAITNTGGFIIALALLLSAFLFRRNVSRRAFLAETISLALLAAATGVGQWVIAARMVQLRAAMGRPIDDVPADDPLRLAFGALHGYSVTALAVGVVAAGVALLLIARRKSR
ncbi:MAG TPA: DUF4149 domain-containing protein [Pyrinomonadaceae bacterium]|nr:DUF4149 domain-containing protein [Pyrinomonadaceae bacterium]